jgi:CheY-like chemotaxis protein
LWFYQNKCVIFLIAAQIAQDRQRWGRVFHRERDEGTMLANEPSRLSSSSRIEILLIDCNLAEVRLISETFRAAGITSDLRNITDLKEALLYARRQGQYASAPTPGLIFLNLSLREEEGLDVLKEIKATPFLKDIPVVIASGSDDPSLLSAVHELSRNCFIRKPSELGELLSFIKACYQFWGSAVTPNPGPESRE